MTETADVILVGAGVVGLAVARALARSGREVIVVEKENAIGTETSARNSEVIHAGIYYRPSGMRGRLAVKGRDALYDYCKSHGVNYTRCGKLLVATRPDERSKLDALIKNAEANGVTDLEIISGADAASLEPGLKCDAAIVSPSSGIVDSHGLMVALLGDLEEAGGALALSSPLIRGEVVGDGVEVEIGGADPITLRARLLVNCAGLWSDRVARSVTGIPTASIPSLQFGKGQYFTYAGKAPFERLIYPIPTPDSQGVHYTRDLGGQAKLGPDLNFVDRNDDYDVDENLAGAFAAAAQSFWPDLDPEKLTPGYAGIRPKIAGPGKEGDFLIRGPESHGIASYIGLYGVESPGLTTCLAIAEHVVEIAS